MTQPCILTDAARDRDGYGRVWYRGRVRSAHAVAWEREHGAIPPGLVALHRCDNPPCILALPLLPDGSHDPEEHIFLGSQADNLADMRAKGRHQHGATHHAAKLDDEAVRAIRRRLADGAYQSVVAREHGIAQSVVSDLARGKTWGHVR